MRIVFIAGPYFGDGKYETIEQNIVDAERVAIELANRNIGFFCPHTHTRHFEFKAKAQESFYLSLDAAMLQLVGHAIVALPRWGTSAGARKEIKWAEENNLSVFYLSSLDDKKTFDMIEKWSREGV